MDYHSKITDNLNRREIISVIMAIKRKIYEDYSKEDLLEFLLDAELLGMDGMFKQLSKSRRSLESIVKEYNHYKLFALCDTKTFFGDNANWEEYCQWALEEERRKRYSENDWESED
jgi:hypothetical protein